jgi:hypothetical protein
MNFAKQLDYSDYVLSDGAVNRPQVRGIPSSVFLRMVPRQQKVSDATALSGITQGNWDQSPQCGNAFGNDCIRVCHGFLLTASAQPG